MAPAATPSEAPARSALPITNVPSTRCDVLVIVTALRAVTATTAGSPTAWLVHTQEPSVATGGEAGGQFSVTEQDDPTRMPSMSTGELTVSPDQLAVTAGSPACVQV